MISYLSKYLIEIVQVYYCGRSSENKITLVSNVERNLSLNNYLQVRPLMTFHFVYKGLYCYLFLQEKLSDVRKSPFAFYDKHVYIQVCLAC